MKVLHVCLGCFYIDNYSYQENLIPKYHRLMGYEVSIIASTISFDNNGNSCYVKPGCYVNENGISVTRLPYNRKYPIKVARYIRRFEGTYAAIDKEKPDIIFIHGCQFKDIEKIVKYAKQNKEIKIYVDNHADFSNSARNWLSKNITHKIQWRHCAKLIEPYTEKFYGVLPARVDFLNNIYGIPNEKIDLLVMGADDELVEEAQKNGYRSKIREELYIKESDFLIITGGKIDSSKKQTLLLMEAVRKINRTDVKLIVFGSIIPEMKEEIENLVDGEIIKYIGWLKPEETYRYLIAADLAIYPGRHSVLWEQTAGLGIPMVVKYWDGTTHVDIGGNVKFLYDDSVQEIQDILTEIVCNSNVYQQMKKVASEKGTDIFSYRKIAERCIRIKRG